MNRQQLEELIAIPTLKQIPLGYSDSSLLAFSMAVAHESMRGEYLRQNNCCGEVGAFGLIQMEKLTHDQTWKWGQSIWNNALKLGIITKYQHFEKMHPNVDRLIYDLRYNVFMFRQRMFMKTEPFPQPEPALISKYLKVHWNSARGAASDDSYLKDYEAWK